MFRFPLTTSLYCTVRLALVAALIACASTASAQDKAPPSEDDTMVDAPWFKVGWPDVKMPKFSWKPSFGGGDKPPAAKGKNPISSALEKVSDTSKQAAADMRVAWDSTMKKLSFGSDETAPQVAQKQKKEPGFWTKMFTNGSNQPEGPQTVTEFIAQERVGTTTR